MRQKASVTPIGRLHFLVSSRSRPQVEHVVDLEPEYEEGGLKFWCSCERFEVNTHHHHAPCHHLQAAVDFVLANYSRRTLGGDFAPLNTSPTE